MFLPANFTDPRNVSQEGLTFVPPPSEGAASWIDQDTGNFWIYGGLVTEPNARFDELWRWNSQTRQWSWWGNGDQKSAGQWPEQLVHPCTWSNAGNLYMFGGGIDPSPNPPYASSALTTSNTLWRYNLATRTWTLVQSIIPGEANIYGAIGVYSAQNRPGGRYDAACSLDSQGLLWLTMGYPLAGQYSDLWSLRNWDTSPEWAFWGEITLSSAPTLTNATHPGGRDGLAAWIDARDVLWIYGGNGLGGIDFGDMWYTDLTALVPSRAAVWSPIFAYPCSPQNCIPTDTYPGARSFPAAWTDRTRTTLYLYGGRTIYGTVTDLWAFDINTRQWVQQLGYLPQDQFYYNTVRNISAPAGQASPSNLPGGRLDPSVAVGASQVLLFGGLGVTTDPQQQTRLNELWSIPICTSCPAGLYGADCTCTSPPPIAAAICTASGPVVLGSVNVSGSVILNGSTIVIGGSLTLQPGTVIDLLPGGGISVGDCLQIGDQVTISLNLPSEPESGTLVQVLASNCTQLQGAEPSVVVKPRYVEKCGRRASGTASSDALSGVTVLLTLSNDCHSRNTALIAGVVVGAIVALVIIVVVVVLLLLKFRVVSLRRNTRSGVRRKIAYPDL